MAEGQRGEPRHQLAIMRHADAEPPGFHTSDAERSLTELGRHRAADRRGIVQAFEPSLTLCSSARRTQQTMAELGDAIGEHLIEEALYHASPTSLLERLTVLEEDARRVLVIAHMPTVRMLAEGLIGRAAADRAGGLPFAPGAVAVLDVDVRWAAVDGGVASLAAFHP